MKIILCQMDAATDVIQTGDGRLYHGRARSRSSNDTAADSQQIQSAITNRRRSRARSRERNEHNSCGKHNVSLFDDNRCVDHKLV